MSKLERYIIVTVVTAVVFFLVWYFSSIVLYVVFSFMLSLMGKPLMDLICKLKYKGHHVPRWIGATTVLFMFIAFLMLFLQLVIPVLYDKFALYTSEHMSDLQYALQEPIRRINELVAKFISDGSGSVQSEEIISGLSDRFSGVAKSTLKNIGSIIDFATSFMVATFAIFFITFFFLKEERLFKNGLLTLFPAKYECKINAALDSSIKLLSKYFIALLIESSVKLIIITVGLYAFGVDFATSFIIGFISAILNVIPYIGPLIGAIIGTLIALVVYPGDIESLFFYSIALFAIFQIIDNVIIQPYIYSTSVKAHPLEIFLIILLAGSFAGVWGMLLAIPVYTILRVFAREFFNNLRVIRKLTDSIDK